MIKDTSDITQTPIEIDILRCPTSHGDLDADLYCAQSRTQYTYEAGVYNLLPKKLATVKQGEDTVYADNSRELRGIQERPWRKFVGRNELIRFDYEVVDLFQGGRFLELGGESCFCSAIFKSVFPDSMVYASDVSPNTLRNVALPTCQFFPGQPDVYIAVDAEAIPFKDGVFDSVLAMTMIHHLPNPIQMLREVDRILKPGGTFVAIDHCIPRHFQWVFSRIADDRAAEYGIQEALISYPAWEAIIRETPIPRKSIHIYTNPKYQYNPLFVLAGQVITRVPTALAKYLFPVGIMIVYRKELFV